MEPYLFYGVVLPERAQITTGLSTKFVHPALGFSATATLSIYVNQIAVWIDTENDWDILDLRNVVKTLVQDHLDQVGYLLGYAYDCEITRVLNRGRGVDQVFGIDIPCLRGRIHPSDVEGALIRIKRKSVGPEGVFLRRCFSDLGSSMKHADDTGFYCYRAIEALRQHCASIHGLVDAHKQHQWEKFRAISGQDEDILRKIKLAADPLRHGNVSNMTSSDRANLFLMTWTVVDAYLNAIPDPVPG